MKRREFLIGAAATGVAAGIGVGAASAAEVAKVKPNGTDYSSRAIRYSHAVVDGEISTNESVRIAANKYLAMIGMADSGFAPYRYSARHVNEYCSFAESLRHPEHGLWVKNQDHPFIRLADWQIWVESAIHGFRSVDGDDPWVVVANVSAPRKCGHSLSMAIDAHYSNAAGLGVYSIGYTKRDASFEAKNSESVFRHNRDTLPPMRMGVLAHDDFAGRGLNRSLFISTTHMQNLPILPVGSRSRRSGCIGVHEAPRNEVSPSTSIFEVRYGADINDNVERNAFNWELIEKCNPMIGISTSRDSVLELQETAKKSPHSRKEYIRTILNTTAA